MQRTQRAARIRRDLSKAGVPFNFRLVLIEIPTILHALHPAYSAFLCPVLCSLETADAFFPLSSVGRLWQVATMSSSTRRGYFLMARFRVSLLVLGYTHKSSTPQDHKTATPQTQRGARTCELALQHTCESQQDTHGTHVPTSHRTPVQRDTHHMVAGQSTDSTAAPTAQQHSSTRDKFSFVVPVDKRIEMIVWFCSNVCCL